VDSFVRQVESEAHGTRKQLYLLVKFLVFLMRHSKIARKYLVRAQRRFTPKIYQDLFERYTPDLVVASTPGWRFDRYLLREAAANGIPTASVIVGWDNPSSYSLSGADMDWVTCWSEIQKEELMKGSDWDEDQIFIGGIPSYDGYIDRTWLIDRETYFQQHNLDPERKLIAYANSFNSFSPNIQNIEALIRIVVGNTLSQPSQLLIRLHPNHFMDVERFIQEREHIYQLAKDHELVHVVEPVALGGSLGHYSGEDMPEKTSMMAHSDVFVTVYSTMAVEASVLEKPVVALTIDSVAGWTDKYYLPLSQISGWPTHDRFRKSNSGKVASTQEELQQWLNYYLEYPQADLIERSKFVQDECTYVDGSAGKRTAKNILAMMKKAITSKETGN
jgi:CDP-glycerol glycerophosphotransferase (TagB/SpsB family)